MTLEEIKQSVKEGKKVCHQNDLYEVRLSKNGEYLIVCTTNNYTIGLTWCDGVTMNGKEEEFYIK